MKAFASPHSIARTRRRVPTGEELSDQIAHMFDNPDAEVKAIQVNNDRQVIQAVQSILKIYGEADNWDLKLDAVKKIMGIVKGGACNYISFVQQVVKFEPLLSECILNMRSTLVKYACLLIAQLSQKLCESFANAVITLIPTLFRPTQNGTQIIADSCKLALLNIARHCQGKKVLLAILEAHTSKSAVQRKIVANSLFLVASNWDQDYMISNFKQVEKALIALLADSSSESRQFARDTVRKLSEIAPERCQKIYSQMDMRTKTSFNAEYDGPLPAAMTVRPSKRSASVGPRKRSQQRHGGMSMIAPSTPSFETDERQYLSYLKQLMLQGDSQEIKEHADDISKNLTAALKMDDTEMMVLAMTMLNDIMVVIADSFGRFLPDIIDALVLGTRSELMKVRRLADKTLNGLCDIYNHNVLTESCLKCKSSVKLLYFLNRLINNGQVLMSTNVVHGAMKMCIDVYSETYDHENDREVAKDVLGMMLESWSQEFHEGGKLLNDNDHELLVDLGLLEMGGNEADDALASGHGEEEEQTHEEPAIQEEEEINEPPHKEPAKQEEEEINEPLHEEEEQVEEVAIPQEEEEPPVETSLPRADDMPFRNEVIVHKPIAKLFTEEVLSVPPEKHLMWSIQTNNDTSITIEPSIVKEEIRSPPQRKLQLGVTTPIDLPPCDIPITSPPESPEKTDELVPKKRQTKRFSTKPDPEEPETITPRKVIRKKESQTNQNRVVPKSEQEIATPQVLSMKPKKAPMQSRNPPKRSQQDRDIQKVRDSISSVIGKPTLQQLVRSLLATKDKAPIIAEIGDIIEKDEGQGMEIVLPHLIRLTKSPFSTDVERVIQLIGTFATSSTLLDTTIALLSEPDPSVFIDFLTRVIACATKGELTPRVPKIMAKIIPYLEHTSAEVRKHSVLCVVELRCVLGASFDNEINRLKNVPRKLVIHYFQKRLQC